MEKDKHNDFIIQENIISFHRNNIKDTNNFRENNNSGLKTTIQQIVKPKIEQNNEFTVKFNIYLRTMYKE